MGNFWGIIQSNTDIIKSSDTFKITCTRVNLPVGSGRRRPGLFNSFDEECRSRKSIVVIKNKDNLCLPRALVVAKAHAKKDPEWALIRANKGRRQDLKARKLLDKTQIDIPTDGAGVTELENSNLT